MAVKRRPLVGSGDGREEPKEGGEGVIGLEGLSHPVSQADSLKWECICLVLRIQRKRKREEKERRPCAGHPAEK